jgi:ribonuclease P protein component
MNFRLQKNERLHSKKLIKELFDKGSSFFLYPYKVIMLTNHPEITGTNQVLFSVSKKKLKRAVDRNLVKRRLKEIYRLHKEQLQLASGNSKIIAIIYVAPEILPFQQLESKLVKLLSKAQSQDHSKNS